MVLDLGDNLDVSTLLAEDLTDGADIATLADERSKIMSRSCSTANSMSLRSLSEMAGRSTSVMGRLTPFLDERTPLLTARTLTSLSLSMSRTWSERIPSSNVDSSANLDLLGKVLVVNVEVLETALLSVGIVGGDVELVTHGDLDILAVDHNTGSHLGAFGVKSDGKGSTGSLSNNGACVVDDRLEVFVGTVGSIETDDVHTILAKGAEHLDIVGLGAMVAMIEVLRKNLLSTPCSRGLSEAYHSS